MLISPVMFAYLNEKTKIKNQNLFGVTERNMLGVVFGLVINSRKANICLPFELKYVDPITHGSIFMAVQHETA